MKLLFIILCLVNLYSCSIEKKVARTYRDAEIYNPLSREDSLHLLRASKKVIKEKPPKIIQGKTIRVPVPIKTYILDSLRLTEIEDSLGIAAAEDRNNLVDDCNKSVIDARNKALQAGIKEGYNQRNKELAKDGINVPIPADTIPPDFELLAELKDCQLSLRIIQDSALFYRTLYVEKKKQAKNRLWLIIALSILLGASFFFNIKKTFTGLKLTK